MNRCFQSLRSLLPVIGTLIAWPLVTRPLAGFVFGIWVATALWGNPVAHGDAPGNPPLFRFAQDAGADSGVDCTQELNRRITSEHGWSIFMRGVAVGNGQVQISVSLRNSNARSGLIALAPDVGQHTKLLAPVSETSYAVEDIEGIEPRLQKIEKRTTQVVYFTFPYPDNVRQVTFTTLLVTPIMRGAGQKILLEFPIPLPELASCLA